MGEVNIFEHMRNAEPSSTKSKPELRGFGGSPLLKPSFGVSSR